MCCGANEGDGMSFAAELVLDDVYELSGIARAQVVTICFSDDASRVASDSKIGVPGSTIHFDCTATLMDAQSQVTEVVILVEVDGAGLTQDIYLLPLVPLRAKTGYRLLRVDTDAALHKFAQRSSVSVVRGTDITLASGRQCPVEQLQPGAPVLTRDHGAQSVRWIAQSTDRATGGFAPIRICAGALYNTKDMIISPNQLFHFYQRMGCLGTGQPAVQIKAEALVNGHTVTPLRGGFMDHFQLIFDRPQVIYAEGIAIETTGIESAQITFTTPEPRTASLPCRDMINAERQPIEIISPDPVDLIRRATAG